MIDDYLRDLFSPDPAVGSGPPPGMMDYFKAGGKDFGLDIADTIGGTSKGPNFGNRNQMLGREPATFDQRFQPAIDNPLMPAPTDDGAMLPPGARPMEGIAPSFKAMEDKALADRLAGAPGGMPTTDGSGGGMPPMGGPVPLPVPRPADLGARLAGGGAPGGPMPMPGAMPGAPPMAQAAPPPDFMQRLSGVIGDPLNLKRQEAGAEGPKGIIGRLAGMDGAAEKRLASTIAGGFKGGNPAFKGGAFMNGAGGGAAGGLKSDKEDTEAATAAADKTQKQGNFERTQGDKEKTTEALRKLYGQRGDAAVTRANTPGGGGKTPWNKPPHERLKDAENLIINKQKSLYGQINPLAPKAERDAQRAAADKELSGFKQKIYKGYGIDENGTETTPNQGGGGDVPSATPSPGSGNMRGGGTYQDPHIPTSQQEFDKIKPGTFFINPSDGEILRKKGQNTSALDGGDMSDSEAA